MNRQINLQNKESYNSSAAEYNRKFSDYSVYREQINIFSNMIPDASEILDIGCGPGINAGIFTDAGHIVTGFDFSENMISLAEENCPSGTFSVNSVEDFTAESRYDAICLSFIIVHLEDSQVINLIKKLEQWIKPGGYVYISFMSGKPPGPEQTSFSDSQIFFNYFTQGYIINLFNKYNFNNIYKSKMPYKEPDGSVTEDIFLIFQNVKKENHNDSGKTV